MNERVQPWVSNIPSTRRWIVGGLIAAVVGAIVFGLGLWLDPERARHSYLAAFAGITAVSLGGLVFLMIVNAMDASWPVVVRRPIEAVVSPLLPLALAFVPVALWLPELYPWAGTEPMAVPEHAQHLLEHKEPWLDEPWFIGRTAIYFVLWIVVSAALLGLSHRHDGHADRRLVSRARAISVGTLPLMALALTGAAFDWLMSLDPLWMSTIFGLYYFAGGFGGAMAVVILVVGALDRRELLRPLLGPSHYSALGRVMLAATALWGYFAFFQLMLIWIANRPDEVAWYIDRTRGAWEGLAVTLAVVHLALPLLALLSYRLKRQRKPLCWVAVVLLIGHVLDVHWVVVPRSGSAWPVHWLDPGPWLLLGGLAIAWSAWRIQGRAVVPRHDPRLPQGVRYRSD